MESCKSSDPDTQMDVHLFEDTVRTRGETIRYYFIQPKLNDMFSYIDISMIVP